MEFAQQTGYFPTGPDNVDWTPEPAPAVSPDATKVINERMQDIAQKAGEIDGAHVEVVDQSDILRNN